MENNQNETITTEDALREILENSRAVKKYMKWQLYITIVLVIVPLLALVFIVPMVFSSLTSSYSGLLQ
jgi:predicted anti-sigma-YlaC factor YlaD